MSSKVSPETELYTLTNCNGCSASVIPYGGIITSINMPDRAGRIEDIVLGFDDPGDYLRRNEPFFGAICGRSANRIGGARFSLDGREFSLHANDGPNSLHGGAKGFDKVCWSVEQLSDSLRLSYLSADGEEGYPGNLTCTVEYRLSDENELAISYSAVTDAATVINLTNHSYFNLSAGQAPTVADHIVSVNADHYTPVDDLLIPTGELADVTGTVFDLRTPVRLAERLAETGGFDHNYVLKSGGVSAKVYDPLSGRIMEMRTTEPGVQFYTGLHLEGIQGKAGRKYQSFSGLCLEAQHYPDSINKPQFPSVILKPGEIYNQVTAYKFSSD